MVSMENMHAHISAATFQFKIAHHNVVALQLCSLLSWHSVQRKFGTMHVHHKTSCIVCGQCMLTVYHHPSTYPQYLRNVLASWLLTNKVVVLNVVDKSIFHAIESLTLPLSIFRQSRSLRTRQISLSLGKKRNVRDSAMSESHRHSVRDSVMSVTGKKNARDSALSESHRQSVSANTLIK